LTGQSFPAEVCELACHPSVDGQLWPGFVDLHFGEAYCAGGPTGVTLYERAIAVGIDCCRAEVLVVGVLRGPEFEKYEGDPAIGFDYLLEAVCRDE